MKRIIMIGFAIAILSCNGKKKNEVPENIIAPSKMTDVLVDVQILEASMGLNIIRPNDTIHRDTNLFYNVFENNKVTKEQYDKSMDYYMKHPEMLNQIYDSVLVRFDKQKDSLTIKK